MELPPYPLGYREKEKEEMIPEALSLIQFILDLIAQIRLARFSPIIMAHVIRALINKGCLYCLLGMEI